MECLRTAISKKPRSGKGETSCSDASRSSAASPSRWRRCPRWPNRRKWAIRRKRRTCDSSATTTCTPAAPISRPSKSRATATSPISATTAERRTSPSRSTSSPGRPNTTARRSSTLPTQRSRNISRIFRASKAITSRAARRWCASARARRYPRAIRTRSTCCASSAAAAMKSGTSPIRQSRRCSRASSWGSRTRTRASGNATPASPTWCPASKAGGCGG